MKTCEAQKLVPSVRPGMWLQGTFETCGKAASFFLVLIDAEGVSASALLCDSCAELSRVQLSEAFERGRANLEPIE